MSPTYSMVKQHDQMRKMRNRHRAANERMEHAAKRWQGASSTRETLRLPTVRKDVQGRGQACRSLT
jgi:hypothetical protein